MVIAESLYDYSKLCNTLEKYDFIFIPVFSNNRTHPSKNKISLLFFNFIENNESYLVSFDHPDCINLSQEQIKNIESIVVSSKNKKFIIDKGEVQHYFNSELDDSWLDMKMLDYVDNGKLKINFNEYTPAHTFISRKFYREDKTNMLIPVVKHIEYLEDNAKKIKNLIHNSENINSIAYKNMNSILLNSLYNIEAGKIKARGSMLKKEAVCGDFAYSKYNPYTATGRPSCTYRGFNFMGMNKEDDSRKNFISRFGQNGMLLLIDYSACHFYLMAELIGESFAENPYDFLGKFYFNKNELTEEEHEQAKQLSFNIIYGGISDEFLIIPFFDKIKKFIFELYDFNLNHGYFETPYFKRKVKSKKTTPYKLFSYFMQAMETESHMIILKDVFKKLEKYETKVILYVYDSILIDFNINEGRRIIDDIVFIMEQDGKFPVKISYGTNYKEMHRFL